MKNSVKVIFNKTTPCKSCQEYIYKLPYSVDASLADFLVPLGSVLYPLDKFKVFMINNENIMIDSMLGRTDLRIKFKAQSVVMSALFKQSLSNWIESKGAAAEFIAA